MHPRDRGLKALRTLFPDGHTTDSDIKVSERLDGRDLKSMKTRPAYEFLVHLPEGKNAVAGCWFSDEFFEMFTDDELVKAFKERFVITPA